MPANAFRVGGSQKRSLSPSVLVGTLYQRTRPATTWTQTKTQLCMSEPERDVSRSGTRTGRLDRLAELEADRVETDKGAVGVAAGAFAAIILVSVMAAITLLQGPI